MPPSVRLSRPALGFAAAGLRKPIPPAIYGLTGLALRGRELGVLPAPPRLLGEFAIRTALRVNDLVLNWTIMDCSEDENTRPGCLGLPDTGDNDGMSLGELSYQTGEGEMSAGTAPGGAVQAGTGASPADD